jgi:hypothetical protein
VCANDHVLSRGRPARWVSKTLNGLLKGTAMSTHTTETLQTAFRGLEKLSPDRSLHIRKPRRRTSGRAAHRAARRVCHWLKTITYSIQS